MIARKMFGIFAVPLAITQWTVVPVGSQNPPEVKSSGAEWDVKSNGSAGGYAYLLPPEIAQNASMIRWEWRVASFPKAEVKIPFEKSSDDYALRVGALLSDGEKGIRVPSRIQGMLDAAKQRISYIVFYCAVPKLPQGPACAISPYNDHIINCLIQADATYKAVDSRPVEDAIKYFGLSDRVRASLRTIGLWVFADSDNSHSSSEASLRALTVAAGMEEAERKR